MIINKKIATRLLASFIILTTLFVVKVFINLHPEVVISNCHELSSLKVCGVPEADAQGLSILDHKLQKVAELKNHSDLEPTLYVVRGKIQAFLLGVSSAQPIIHRPSISAVIYYDPTPSLRLIGDRKRLNETAYQLVQAQVSAYLGSSGYSDVPLWILSGLGHWASDDAFDYNQTLTWFKMADSRITKSTQAEELKSQLIVTYLLERQGESIESLLKIRENPKTIISDMF